MNNRRKDYRHTFAPQDRLRVQLQPLNSPASLQCELVNLSTEGMLIQLPDEVPQPREHDRFLVTLLLPQTTTPLTIIARVVNARPVVPDRCCCIHFMPSANPESDMNRESIIWKFLTAEQRKELSKRRRASEQ